MGPQSYMQAYIWYSFLCCGRAYAAVKSEPKLTGVFDEEADVKSSQVENIQNSPVLVFLSDPPLSTLAGHTVSQILQYPVL